MDMKKPKILIVEDERIIALDLKMRLEYNGYDVLDVVSTAEAAVKIALTRSVNLILMDIKLQGKMDGIDAAHQISEKTNIAIVLLSGNSDLLASKRLKNVKPSATLRKPIMDWELFEAIDMALKVN